MKLICIAHRFNYELENIIRIFLPYEKTEVVFGDAPALPPYAVCAVSGNTATVRLDLGNGVRELTDEVLPDFSAADTERTLAVMLWQLLRAELSYTPKWGILTGVRPSKLMRSLVSQAGERSALKRFSEVLLVSPEKAELALAVARAEEKIIATDTPDSFSLYIAIPFCPTRCAYCSFVSHAIESESAKKTVEPYIRLLPKEIELIGKIANDLGLKIRSVYWGGGTPTSLTARQMEPVFKAIASAFDVSGVPEYTVEAGRPDTITEDKLRLMREYGVTRLSVNPQTFNDSVLALIGRRHSAEDTLRAYSRARDAGFRDINMDFIAGLPGDTPESFGDSIDTALSLKPENITVHTLALKRSSAIVTENKTDTLRADMTGGMLDYASFALSGGGYAPYYMYRQSRSLGNLENVGYSLSGHECAYNVFMMEECQTVLAAGAGAVTKLSAGGAAHIERIFNFKFPYEYISRFSELMSRKDGIYSFYKAYR